jgi:hypothetical protein
MCSAFSVQRSGNQSSDVGGRGAEHERQMPDDGGRTTEDGESEVGKKRRSEGQKVLGSEVGSLRARCRPSALIRPSCQRNGRLSGAQALRAGAVVHRFSQS